MTYVDLHETMRLRFNRDILGGVRLPCFWSSLLEYKHGYRALLESAMKMKFESRGAKLMLDLMKVIMEQKGVLAMKFLR